MSTSFTRGLMTTPHLTSNVPQGFISCTILKSSTCFTLTIAYLQNHKTLSVSDARCCDAAHVHVSKRKAALSPDKGSDSCTHNYTHTHTHACPCTMPFVFWLSLPLPVEADRTDSRLLQSN